jgi:hypothetical protein
MRVMDRGCGGDSTKRVRKQKTDRQDAQLLLRLMMEGRFPRIWVADAENRDLQQLLWHRHRLVQIRTLGDGSIACGDAQRSCPAQESNVAAGRSEGTGIVSSVSLGQSATSGPDRCTRSTHAEDPGTDAVVFGSPA